MKTGAVTLAGAVALAFLFGAVGWGRAEETYRLRPDEVLVIANRQSAASLGVAAEYLRQRGIPEDHLVRVWIPPTETCSRSDYESRVRAPIRRYLKDHDPDARIRCLVTCFGVPLKVAAPDLTHAEKAEAETLRKRQNDLRERLRRTQAEVPGAGAAADTGAGAKAEAKPREGAEPAVKGGPGPSAGQSAARGALETGGATAALAQQLDEVARELRRFDRSDQGAALDSELALALEDNVPLAGWRPNPLFVGFRDRDRSGWPKRVLMVARLDGPTPDIAKRLIADALWAEQNGLKGSAYFDARWEMPPPEKVQDVAKEMGYGFYDLSIHLAAKRIEASGRLPVVLDHTEALFAPGSAPNAALYCGWYSLARYVPAFTWTRGAVGYHIASGECATLRAGSSQVWCKRMLEEGAAATVGPVAEPYVQAFPVPELFFALLTDGRYSLVEAYFLSLPVLSWQMVLVGDPLYRPFQP